MPFFESSNFFELFLFWGLTFISRSIYFDTYNHIELRDYNKTMRGMVDYFTKEYNKKKLNEYKPLDLGEIEKRIAQKNA